MPTYDYYCTKCGHHVEAFQKMSDPLLKFCEKCKGDTLARRPGGGGFHLSGDGFYSTMYKDNDKDAQKDTNTSTNSGSCCPCGKNKGSCSSN